VAGIELDQHVTLDQYCTNQVVKRGKGLKKYLEGFEGKGEIRHDYILSLWRGGREIRAKIKNINAGGVPPLQILLAAGSFCSHFMGLSGKDTRSGGLLECRS